MSVQMSGVCSGGTINALLLLGLKRDVSSKRLLIFASHFLSDLNGTPCSSVTVVSTHQPAQMWETKRPHDVVRGSVVQVRLTPGQESQVSTVTET